MSAMVSQDKNIDNHTYDEKNGSTHTHEKHSKCACCKSSDGHDSAFGHGCRSTMYWIIYLGENSEVPVERYINDS